ncbi:MAG: DUF4411 family protein [Desulfobulbaceae bacterium]|nr:DUF4411 family protein [Desulfobulbaceae bacterium]
MRYCLDANIFIQAKNFHYHFDICPGFWDWLDQQIETVGSIVPICEELVAGNDELKPWAKDRKETGFFADIYDPAVQEVFRAIAVYVEIQYETHQAGKFLDGADPWLIAYSQVNDCVIVTSEILSPGAKKVKIPNICEEFGVDYTDCFTMLKGLNARFVLDV